MEYKMLSAMIKNNINTVQSTSVGRLFDAVSAMLGIARTSTFEGDAAMSLEFAAVNWKKRNGNATVALPTAAQEMPMAAVATPATFVKA